MPLGFHPLVQEWFANRFEGPTEAQVEGWEAIAKGRNTLIAAPTGSGKTLAAFMTCIDQLVRTGLNGGLPERTEVVYVSPLKALSNDIQRNLADPLDGIRELAEAQGTPLPEIRVGVRTGDTPQSERTAMAKRPPHVLITTPESLYILLTSESGRRGLQGVRTLILDEIHAVADDKRGSHLSLSVERLCNLADGPVTRIGLSATQRPIEEVARFLVGSEHIDADGTPDCLVINTGHAREMELAIEMPPEELGPIATHEQWASSLDRVAELIQEHTTTLVFVNTRRLVERVSHQLGERLGEDAVVAHHGSLSWETRLKAEQRLKSGDAKVCVATASLELGIDVGAVDLVCQIGSPRSIGLLLQRVGRSGHSLGAMPNGRLFPLTRDELLECIALLRGIHGGNLDTLTIPPWPLDVLAQQIVASCANEDWDEDALFAFCQRAYPYRELPREKYDQIIDILSNGVAPREGRGTAYLHRDGVNHILRGRRNARIAAVTSGGAIPDNADYDVIAEPDGTFVGTVNEDFAIESVAGDVFLLGNTPWKIRRVESGRVRVEDAQGSNPTLPFWLGEAPGRTPELSDEVSDLREDLLQHQDTSDGVQWLMKQAGIQESAAEQAMAYVAEGVRVLGAVPTKQRVVAERFFDESGGMQMVIHAPFGAKINRAWGMALRKQMCRSFDFELQAAATDDGISLALGPSTSFPMEDVFRYLSPKKVESVLTQAILQAPLFGTRWRWDASRALALLRHTGGRKVPPPIQRMRSDDLRAAVFPAQVACQDNALPGDVEIPDHPLVFETMRDCLTEAMDVEGLRNVLLDIEAGKIETYAKDTPQPSAFSHQILNAMPYAFLDDAPLEERRARAVTLRRALPEDSREMGALNPDAIARATQGAWPVIRDADELHDTLLTLVVLPVNELDRSASLASIEQLQGWFNSLAADRRVAQFAFDDGRAVWVAAETLHEAQALYPDASFAPTLTPMSEPPEEEDAALALMRGWTESIGPFTEAGLSEMLSLRPPLIQIGLANLEATGGILRGSFTPGSTVEEFCNRRILARISRDTVSGLRQEVEPVPSATYIRFLFGWQHASPGTRAQHNGSLLQVIEQLQGFEAAASAWETELLPLRMAGYDASALDRLCIGGEAVWGRFNRRSLDDELAGGRAALARTGPLSLGLREDLGWLLDPPADEAPPSGAAGETLAFLQDHGASFIGDIIAGTHRMPSEIEGALWQLVAAGLVTADGFGALRSLVNGTAKRVQSNRRSRRPARQRVASSRWSLLQSFEFSENAIEERAFQLLRRYGIVFPEVLGREPMAPSWRSLLQVYRRAEARGEIRGGRFVAGYVGEQFALPEAVETMRAVRKAAPSEELIAVSACDPLNLAGVLTPGQRVPALIGNRVVFRDGVPLASLQGGDVVMHADLSTEDQDEVHRFLQPTNKLTADYLSPIAAKVASTR
jgi:ATP-dependent Lhr-like helicase